MKRFLTAVALTALALVPLALAYWLPERRAGLAVILFLLVLLRIIYSAMCRRDERVAVVRDAELDAIFDGVFSDYEADLGRFPFRVHVFRRGGLFPVETLEMIYHYRTHSTDPDRELRFYRYFGGEGEGLVWQSCQHGDIRYFRRDDITDTKSAFHLRGSQDTATHELIAVLALPLRQLVGQDPAAPSQQIGVLTFDALTTDAADALGQLFVTYRSGEQSAIAELADRVSLYVG